MISTSFVKFFFVNSVDDVTFLYIQEPAWKTHVWKKGRDKKATSKKPRRKFHFKQIAR